MQLPVTQIFLTPLMSILKLSKRKLKISWAMGTNKSFTTIFLKGRLACDTTFESLVITLNLTLSSNNPLLDTSMNLFRSRSLWLFKRNYLAHATDTVPSEDRLSELKGLQPNKKSIFQSPVTQTHAESDCISVVLQWITKAEICRQVIETSTLPRKINSTQVWELKVPRAYEVTVRLCWTPS